jgi:hypothetical protein
MSTNTPSPRQGPTAADVVQLLQTAFPKAWERHLRNRLGATDPAELTPAELARFADHVFWLVKQTGIRDPAAWLAFRAQRDATMAPVERGSPVEIGDIAAQRKSAEREPVALENSPATTSTASPPRPVARTVACGTTKAEVLSRAKAAVEAGESPRDTAERLASAKEDFHASQREIGRAVGRSASWVNRLLKWRRSGYKQSSPFGPTTRAGRAAHRNDNNNDSGGCGGAEQLDDDGNVSLIGHCWPLYQPVSLPAPMNENLPSGSKQNELLPSAEAATRETKGPKTQTTPLEDPGRKLGRSGSRQLEKQKLPARNSKVGQKLSPERMRIVLDALKEYPVLARAAAKAGIHRKTLTYWLKCSEAGHDGYDIEWQGVQWRFHEHCKSAIDEAHDMLLLLVWQMAMGVTFKTDENGNLIERVVGRPNPKMIQFYLEWMRPEKWGKHRKSDNILRTGGVLVIGERTEEPENSCAASIKARKWKSVSRKVREPKA